MVQYLPQVDPERPPKKYKILNRQNISKHDEEFFFTVLLPIDSGSAVKSLLEAVSPCCTELLASASEGIVAGEEASILVLYSGVLLLPGWFTLSCGEFDGAEPAGEGLISKLLIWSSDNTGVEVFFERMFGIFWKN